MGAAMGWGGGLVLLLFVVDVASPNSASINVCARELSEKLVELFNKTTFYQEIEKIYGKHMKEESLDGRTELKKSKKIIEDYIKGRAKDAYLAKISLQGRPILNLTPETKQRLNNKDAKEFIRYMNAKQGTDATVIYEDNHFTLPLFINASKTFNFTHNANFYNLPTSSFASAVHVPTPIYDRKPSFLADIEWSQIDELYRKRREKTRDLAFQMFCSESGFMRFFPATSWYWDNPDATLDLFDCRNTEWYINGATCSKNVIIMLDMSGSMLGQRYEIAKQTTEAILDTLAHNDYFHIMTFSKTASFIGSCKGNETTRLLQATMRNKKMLREKMDNISSEGKADYEQALVLAFDTIKGLPRTYSWLTKEEYLAGGRNFSDYEVVHLAEHVLLLPLGYRELMQNATENTTHKGCENVIMLITDGAPDTYKETFNICNPDKKVRFFSFLIGEEAIDFDQVRKMACENRGFMVHIANMADVEEKVQHYIRVLSRAVGDHAEGVEETDAVWSGVYRERLYLPRPEKFTMPSPGINRTYAVMHQVAAKKKMHLRRSEARGRMFVATVSYPVAINGTFKGVAAVNIPLTEISQLAAPMLIGARSYYFMLDQNGFVMFHPQLRPIQIEGTKKENRKQFHKPNYNNMEFLELEVAQKPNKDKTKGKVKDEEYLEEERDGIWKNILQCNNPGADSMKMDMIFASEILDRIYPQTNTYYAECVGNNNDFILGLAVAKDDEYRIDLQGGTDYDAIDMDWVAEDDWRLHPHWRYCLLNDTDTMPKEAAFAVYLNETKKHGKLPALCTHRSRLVERTIWDLKATAEVKKRWLGNDRHMQSHEAHLVFFTSPSGVIRFHNINLTNFEYADPTFDIFGYMFMDEHVSPQEKYEHFIKETNRKSVDDKYYRRAIRNDGVIVFDVNYFSKIWYKTEQETPYGDRTNVSMLFSIYKTLYLKNAIIGVAGMEMGYDPFVKIMANHGCQVQNDSKWCVLLDEHGYVFYTNQEKMVVYDDFYKESGDQHLGRWFGEINRVGQRVMQLLVQNKFYVPHEYIDHQATCNIERPKSMAASRPTTWVSSAVRLLLSSMRRLLSHLPSLPVLSVLREWLPPVEAYTTSFHDIKDRMACSKKRTFYFINREADRPKQNNLVAGDLSEYPCSGCIMKMRAAFVENTNLVMVWMEQDSTSKGCFSDTCTIYDGDKNPVPYKWTPVDAPSKNDGDDSKCRAKEKSKTKAKRKCFLEASGKGKQPCDGESSIPFLLSLLALFSFCIFSLS